MSIKRVIRDFFGFSKTEVNGALVLVFLIIFLLSTPYLFRQISGVNNFTEHEDKRLLDSLISFLDTNQMEVNSDAVMEPVYTDFDPNSATVKVFERMGVPSFLAVRIDNYRSKGGVFKVKSDLLKIYDFPDSLYKQLFNYITLPTEVTKSPPVTFKKPRATEAKIELSQPMVLEKEKLFKIDINTADTSALKQIRGIGTSYAKRIVAYRKLLGGYHSIAQLNEVYGMNDTLYTKIESYFVLSDTLLLRKIPINLATFKELLAHPYIDYEQTKELLNVKSKYGKFRKPEDLYRLQLMDSAAIIRLLPYLSF